MSNLARRENTIIKAGSGDGNPEWGASYQVIAYEVGAQVTTAASDSNTVAVRSGHGFAAGDKFIVGTDESTYRTILTAAAQLLTLAGGTVVTVAKGDLLTNLGVDLGSPTPNYDKSGVTIYSDMAGEDSAISGSKVTCNSVGVYGYWHSTPGVWELVLDSAGDPVAVIPDVVVGSVVGSTSSTDNALVRFDGTTGKKIQGYTSGAPTVSDTGAVTIPTTVAIGGTLDVTGKTSLAGHITFYTDVGITAGAFVSDGYADAQAVSASVVQVTTVATADDSIRLPVAQTGRLCVVINTNGQGKAIDIYPTVGDLIGEGTAGQAYSLADGSMVIFFSATATYWYGIAAAYADGAA